ncbi:MAG: hypothetical protein WAP23_00515, partial [Candidatus Spechtbacterales bacterium]
LKAAENAYVRCPYFRNPRSGRERWGLTAYSGKGSPREIEEELRIIEKLEGADFSKMQESKIRDIMKKRKLGIECSGFIVRILDAWARELYKKPIYTLIAFNKRGLGWIYSKLRPYTHIDIETLVYPRNAREISDINAIRPGDVIRFNTTIDHAILVTAIESDEEMAVKKIYYVQSVLEANREGVKRGVIEFTSPASCGLRGQRWREDPETGHTINEKGEPRIYRLFIFDKLTKDYAHRAY